MFTRFSLKDYRLIAVDLCKRKALDAEPKAIQQIIFTGQAFDKALKVLYILETILEFAKGTNIVL